MINSEGFSFDGDGRPILPNSGIFPILLETEKLVLKVVGTAFYITRYGLFLTAAHVLEDVFDRKGRERGAMFGLHTRDTGELHLRPVRRFNRHNTFDIALGELDNFMDKVPQSPLANRRGTLSKRRPECGDELVTFAYPNNAPLDFRKPEPPELLNNRFAGSCLRFVEESEHPFMQYPHFEMSVRIGSGASGGPIFCGGTVCGVAARGWDFDGEEFAGQELAYGVPIEHCMDLGLENLLVPEDSWERSRMPLEIADRRFTIRDLIEWGHVSYE